MLGCFITKFHLESSSHNCDTSSGMCHDGYIIVPPDNMPVFELTSNGDDKGGKLRLQRDCFHFLEINRCNVLCRNIIAYTCLYIWIPAHYELPMEKKVPWNGAVSMRSRAGSWEILSICITLRHNQGAPADMHANALGILIICRFPLASFLLCMRIWQLFLWHHVPSSGHFQSL